MNVTFQRVLSIRAKTPGVIAWVDDYLVKWDPRRGWKCDCTGAWNVDDCEHIIAAKTMLDESVFLTVPRRLEVKA